MQPDLCYSFASKKYGIHTLLVQCSIAHRKLYWLSHSCFKPISVSCWTAIDFFSCCSIHSFCKWKILRETLQYLCRVQIIFMILAFFFFMIGNLCKNDIFKSQRHVLMSFGIPAPQGCVCFWEFDSFTHWLSEKCFLASLTVRHPNHFQNQKSSSSYNWKCIFHSSAIFMGSYFPWRSITPNFLVSFHSLDRFFSYIYFSHYIHAYQESCFVFKIILYPDFCY